MRHGKTTPVWLVFAGLLLALIVSDPAVNQQSRSEFWANSVSHPYDPFANMPFGQPSWIKFTILTSEPGVVYFQDSVRYPFHYDFAVAELPSFAGMTRDEFDAVTLHAEWQRAVLGAVLLPQDTSIPEYGIQLVRQDPYTPSEVVDLVSLVASRVVADPAVQALYFPTYEQMETAFANQAWLETRGVTIGSADRWAAGNSCYSHGWALGSLKYVAAGEINDAFLAGELLPGDILLTDGVPAELPFVAGILSLAPSTPNSHVAILANTFGVPFVYLSRAEDAQRAMELVGRKMALRAEEIYGGCLTRLIDVEGVLDPATIEEILQLKQPQPLGISPIATYGAYSDTTDELALEEIAYFGGKAANFGYLRRAIPDHSPVAGAFTFDLWVAFLDQELAGGSTLREWIAWRLAGFSYPPQIDELSQALHEVRDLIKDTEETAFGPLLETAVIQTLQSPQYGFDMNRKIRFRSSTNVEDSESFTGAGLYDSYSGCLADELDGDDLGPSICDPAKPQERGVFRAIRKVFASFYNINAYLERLRYGIREIDVGMAVLVHHSFPDEIELANGVAKLSWNAGTHRQIYLVSQAGAVSVTNPEPGSIPEELAVDVFSFGTYASLIRYSNLVQLGATVLEFDAEYLELADLLLAVGERYAQETGLSVFTLEFEYKKVAPAGKLVVKQVRRLPEADNVPSVTPILIDQPVEYCSFQGEYGAALGNHRLKSRWTIHTRNIWLTPENLQQGLFGEVDLEYTESCLVLDQSGPLSEWPQAVSDFSDGEATSGWVFDFLQNRRRYLLTVSGVPTLVAPSRSPLLVLEDFYCLSLRVDYAQAVPGVDSQGQPHLGFSDYVRVCRCPEEQVGEQLQRRQFGAEDLSVETQFYWPPPPRGHTAGYTAPLSRFVETSISGLTSEPVLLHGEYAQTYRPGHHNFSETFVFEPALDPGISQQQLDQLAEAGVRLLRIDSNDGVMLFDDETWGAICMGCLGADLDGDGWCVSHGVTLDCDDGDPDLWSTPGEVRGLRFRDRDTLTWVEPVDPGAVAPRYDTLVAPSPVTFLGAGSCVEWDDASDTRASVTGEPAPGEVLHYLVRAENDCLSGQGPLGQASSGTPREGVHCP